MSYRHAERIIANLQDLTESTEKHASQPDGRIRKGPAALINSETPPAVALTGCGAFLHFGRAVKFDLEGDRPLCKADDVLSN